MSRTEAAVAVYGTILVVAAFGAGILVGARTRSPRSASPGVDPGSLDGSASPSQAVGALSDDSPQSSERGAAQTLQSLEDGIVLELGEITKRLFLFEEAGDVDRHRAQTVRRNTLNDVLSRIGRPTFEPHPDPEVMAVFGLGQDHPEGQPQSECTCYLGDPHDKTRDEEACAACDRAFWNDPQMFGDVEVEVVTEAGMDRLLAAVFEVTDEEASMMAVDLERPFWATELEQSAAEMTDAEFVQLAVDLERQAPPQLTYEPIAVPSTDNVIARLLDWIDHETDDRYWKLIDEVANYRRALVMVQHPARGGL